MTRFLKMNGLGNDFVIFDLRADHVALETSKIKQIADRRRGIGCDQVILIEPRTRADTDAFMRIYNADGSEVQTCGNATRCVASLLLAETGQSAVTLETRGGLVTAAKASSNGDITVDMGAARLDWRDIPVAHALDTLELPITEGPLRAPTAVSMGNPHCVFFVTDPDAIDMETLGPPLERHALFPEGANIGVASIRANGVLRVRVWERGAGLTLACGSGACAALVAAARRGLTGRQAQVEMDGGFLDIAWREADNHVLMTGPVATSFEGTLLL